MLSSLSTCWEIGDDGLLTITLEQELMALFSRTAIRLRPWPQLSLHGIHRLARHIRLADNVHANALCALIAKCLRQLDRVKEAMSLRVLTAILATVLAEVHRASAVYFRIRERHAQVVRRLHEEALALLTFAAPRLPPRSELFAFHRIDRTTRHAEFADNFHTYTERVVAAKELSCSQRSESAFAFAIRRSCIIAITAEVPHASLGVIQNVSKAFALRQLGRRGCG